LSGQVPTRQKYYRCCPLGLMFGELELAGTAVRKRGWADGRAGGRAGYRYNADEHDTMLTNTSLSSFTESAPSRLMSIARNWSRMAFESCGIPRAGVSRGCFWSKEWRTANCQSATIMGGLSRYGEPELVELSQNVVLGIPRQLLGFFACGRDRLQLEAAHG
jgi:hypothetical protein